MFFPMDDDYYADPEPDPDDPLLQDGQRLAIKQDDGQLVEMTEGMIRYHCPGGRIPRTTPYTGKKIVVL